MMHGQWRIGIRCEWIHSVGWYPTAIVVSPDNQTLLVGNGKGLASRPNFPPETARAGELDPSAGV